MNIEILKEYLSYNEITGEFKWLKSTNRRIVIGSIAGGLNQDGYIIIKFLGKGYRAHSLAWLFTYGEYPEFLDHKNNIRHDNTITNLRIATHLTNSYNKVKESRANKLGLKGVYLDKRINKYIARTKIKGKSKYIGSYDTAELASEAYQSFIKEIRGEFYNAHTF